jgi:hypothetical protein
MARIQLRDTTIYIQDGLSGTAQVDIGNSALASVPVSVTTQGSSTAPLADEVQVAAQFGRAPSGGTYDLYFKDEDANAFSVTGLAYNATAAAVTTAVDSAATTASYPSWTNGDIVIAESGAAGISDGTLTFTFSGASVDDKNWDTIVVDGASLTGVTVSSGTTLGLQSVSLNTADTDRAPVGGRFTIATETGTPIHTITARVLDENNVSLAVTFTTAIASAVSDSDVITFLPQRITVSIGEGDLTWNESREMLYDLDRDQLDTVRLGAETPLEIDLAFTFEYVTTESGQAITPVDAIKQTGEASEWVSSATDQCEPYAVDIYVVHCVPCGTDQDQDFLFQDFRWESLDYSIQDASIAVSGRCNVTDATTTRSSNSNC